MKSLFKFILVLLIQIVLIYESAAQFVPDVKVSNNFTNRPVTKLNYKPIKSWKNNLIGTAELFINNRRSVYEFSKINLQENLSYNQYFNFCNKQFYIQSPYSIMKITY